MAGYEVVKVATNERGGVDVDDLRAKATEDVACLMLTNPNTLGLFDENIDEIAAIDPRGRGDALLRRRQPQRDHGPLAARATWASTSSTSTSTSPSRQPHGGGGPGAGPICVSDRLEPFLPVPRIVRARGRQRRRRGPALRPRPRAPEVDRAAARLPGQLRRLRALLRLHPQPRRRRPRRGLRDRRPQRQLPARAPARGPRRQVPAARLRPHLHARVRPLGPRREDASSASRRSTSPSACSTSASTRRRSTSRCWSTRR